MSRYENEDGVVTEASDGVVAYLAQVTQTKSEKWGWGLGRGPGLKVTTGTMSC